MILLLELHHYGKDQEDDIKEQLAFYSCGKPNAEGELEDSRLLLRLINSMVGIAHPTLHLF